MASLWKRCSILHLLLLLLLLLLQTSSCLLQPAASRAAVSPGVTHRKLLQTPGAALPVPPLKVLSNGQPCVLFQTRKLSLRYEKHKVLDLTDKTFSPASPVDTSQSECSQDQATLVMRFGDVEDLKDLSIRLQLSNTFYESSGLWWFSVDRVSVVYNGSEDVVFVVSEVFAPSSSSFVCPHVSSLQRYSALLLPGSESARSWTLTFTHFQIQAFNVSSSGSFSPASVCSTLMTPAILMGLVTSLILLLVLAYALHMVVHLKHIEHQDQHKAEGCCPPSPELHQHYCPPSPELHQHYSPPSPDLHQHYCPPSPELHQRYCPPSPELQRHCCEDEDAEKNVL